MIGTNTITKAGEMITNLLHTYQGEIDRAVRMAEDGKGVSISISLKMKPVSLTDTDTEATISFTPEKIKDSVGMVINESQGELFNAEEKD